MSSLRLRYALLVVLTLLVPLGVLATLDLQEDRRSILESRVEVLQALAQLLVEHTVQDCPDERTNTLLERFGQSHPEIDILLLDADLIVLASTNADWVGRRWEEEEIAQVIAGDLDQAWDLNLHEEVPVIDLTLAVPPGGRPVAAVHVAETQETLQQELRKALWRDALFALVSVLLLGVLVYGLTDRLIIRRLVGLEHRLEETGWLPDTPRRARDEVDSLEVALHAMLAEIDRTTAELRTTLDERGDLLEQVEGFNAELSRQIEAVRAELEEAQQELLRKERLSALGELAGALAHEVRNPLQIIRGTAELARRRHPDTASLLDDILEEVVRMNLLVHQLLDYTRPLQLHRDVQRVEDLVDRALAEVDTTPHRVEIDVPRGLAVDGDRNLLQRVVVNLVANAVEAHEGEPGCLEIRARGDKGRVVLTLRDDGPGIDPEDLDEVFTPFFSRKEAGTGLGLPLSRRIAETHGGTLTLERAPGGGALATLTLPGAPP